MTARVKPRSSPSAATRRYVGLIRGINVGGRNRLPMAKLVEIFNDAGCADVRTYIQSGNVVFAATPETAKRVPRIVSERIAKRFGFQPLVIVRTVQEIVRVAAGNPFRGDNTDHRALLVGFLNGVPDETRIGTLDPKRSPGDSFRVHGREVYLHLPNGVKSKYTYAYFESTLAMPATFRNWRTVLKLAEMIQGRFSIN